MSLAQQYTETLNRVKMKVLEAISTENEGRDDKVSSLVDGLDQLFEEVVRMPGDSAEFYQAKYFIAEALEDIRVSITQRRSHETGDRRWQEKRAEYLLKIQFATQIIESLEQR